MAWMVDEYSRIKGYNVPGVFTAKPPELWGNPVREYSTGYGVVVAARVTAERYMGACRASGCQFTASATWVSTQPCSPRGRGPR